MMNRRFVHRLLQKGFVLIELAIVVAILAITAAVAVPNFIRFQARAKQSEARMNLKAIYAGEIALVALGIDVSGGAMTEAELRRGAEPFPVVERGYAAPPPGWRR